MSNIFAKEAAKGQKNTCENCISCSVKETNRKGEPVLWRCANMQLPTIWPITKPSAQICAYHSPKLAEPEKIDELYGKYGNGWLIG